MKKLVLSYGFLWLSTLLLFSNVVQGQENVTITGSVKEPNGNSLPGVSVQSVKTNHVTLTNAEGKFSIRVSAGDSLLFKYLGFEPLKRSVDKQSVLNVTLTPAMNQLDQVVVVGYGTQKKRDLSGSISTIGADEINQRRTVQVSDALQGAIPGVAVTRSSGEPGSSSTIQFRGVTTIGNNAPLYIVDGVPYNDIDRLNPSDIESVTALKDAASASIYGSRAAAGVILITTKRAKAGQSSLEYNYEFGLQQATQLPEYAGVTDYLRLYNEFLTNDGSAAIYSDNFINNYLDSNSVNPDHYPNTNWQNVVLEKSAPRQIHNLVFATGNSKIKTRASLGYSDTKGLYANKSFEKLSGSLNNDLQINDKLTANIDISLVRSNDYSPTSNPIGTSRILPPIYDDFYTDGRYAPGKDGANPYAESVDGGYDHKFVSQIQGRGVIRFKPIPSLTLSGIVSPTYTNNRLSTWYKRLDFTDIDDDSRVIAFNRANTSLTESRPYSYIFNAQLLANFNKTFNQVHTLDVLGGYEDNYTYVENLSASRGEFVLNNYPYLNNGTLDLRDNSGNATEAALRSFFSRVSYNYKSKYYLQANLRYDGSSRFNADNRWALFPSFSGAWAISEESFFGHSNQLNFLKLRASWGQAGNERIGNYPYQSNISFNSALFYNNGQIISNTSGAQLNYAVSDISWETQETVDLGLDATFFDNRLNFTGDYYHKQTKDILLDLDIPVYLGYEKPSQNAGKVSSKGYELSLNWKDKVGQVDYAVGFNFSDSKTRIVDLKGTQQLGNVANIEGGEFNEWYGYRSLGLFQTTEEVEESAVLNSNTKPGDVKYQDIDGDGKITPDKDRVLLGGSLPRQIFGLNATAGYKRFSLSFVLQGVGKQLSRLTSYQVQPFADNYGNVPATILGKFWSTNNTTEENLNARYPRLSRSSNSNNYAMSDFYLINGSYLRFKNVTFSYDIPVNRLAKLGINGLQFYAAGNDLFTISHFPDGWDPENTASSYPIVKTWFMGINVRF